MNLSKFPDYFRSYSWKSKHSLYGYPPDAHLKFDWMISLEQRFSWLRNNIETERSAGIYLLKEMIHWGGNQNGILQKFEEGIEHHHLRQLMLALIERLKEPKEAIACALNFPGIGLTYASKMLRFFDPEHYGALDSRILRALKLHEPGATYGIEFSNLQNNVDRYLSFIEYLGRIKNELNDLQVFRPACSFPEGVSSTKWRSADIEMALFAWAKPIKAKQR